MLRRDPLEMNGRVEMTGIEDWVPVCVSTFVYFDVHRSSQLLSRILVVVTHAPRYGMERVRQTIRLLLAYPFFHFLIVHRSWC